MYTVTNNDDLNKAIFENKDKIILLYFGASWCGPCQKLKENFHDDELMKNYDRLAIIYIDVDNDSFSNICDSYDVEALPTQWFTLFEDFSMKRLDQIVGYDWEKFNYIYQMSVEYVDNLKNNKNVNSDENYDNNSSNNSENNLDNNTIF